MKQFFEREMMKTVWSYGKTLIFLVAFSLCIIQPDLFVVERVVTIPTVNSSASYQVLMEQQGRTNGDIYLETFVGGDNELPVITYVVEVGDSLSMIAKQFGTTVNAITQANRLAVDTPLRVGQTIEIAFEEGTIVPVPEAMTIRQFTQAYKLNYEEFLSINYFEEGTDLLEQDEEVFVQLNEREALRVGLLKKEDFVRVAFVEPELPVEPEPIPEPSQQQEEINQLVNQIVAQEIEEELQGIDGVEDSETQDGEEIGQSPSDIGIGENDPDYFEQSVIDPDGDVVNPSTNQAYEQVIINAEETQAYLEALKQKKQEERDAEKKAEEERIKALEAEKKAEELRQQQQAQEAIRQQEEAARVAKLEAERAETAAEQARQAAREAERQATISAQQAVGIEQNYIAPPVSCGDDQCVHKDACFEKPEFSECAPRDPHNAWICRSGYKEYRGDCVKNIPAPAEGGEILKQRYFNPHKADARVRGRGGGQCTAGVAYIWAQNYGIDMRRDLGMRGNAAQWGVNARKVGLTVSSTPIPGSIGWTSRSHGYYGHVVFVEAVYPDEGLMLITDMNYKGAYIFTQRMERINRMDGFIYPPS